MIRPATTVGSLPWAEPRELAGAMKALGGWARAPDQPPDWLRDNQRYLFQRGLAAVRRFGGAMLAIPVGSGKTYVGLAIATTLAPGETIDVVAPAILRSTWLRVASSLSIPIRFVSHELMSRGQRLDLEATGGSPPVIVDESHRLRNVTVARYLTLAQSLVGRRAVLATATPVINRVADLVNQLLLTVADDGLLVYGIPSLRALARDGELHHGLGAVVIGGQVLTDDRPARHSIPIPDWSTGDRLSAVTDGLDRLRLSRARGVQALLRGLLLRAAGSSPAALLGALGRYRGLLAHASDAKRGGHRINRAAIRAVIAPDPEQLVLWELLGREPDGDPDLALGDLKRIDAIERRARAMAGDGDPKLTLLRALLDRTIPTAVFTTSVDTLRYLREQLRAPGVAWVSGDEAGIGLARASRSRVLDLFDPAVTAPIKMPWLLLTTDVSAEGLNLQRLGRVVHYDLPWTPAKLGQREGRIIRPGSISESVQVFHFVVPPAIERRLPIEGTIARKHRVAELLEEIVREDSGAREAGPLVPAWSAVRAAAAGGLAVVLLHRNGEPPVARLLGCVGEDDWSDAPAVVDTLIEITLRGSPVPAGLARIDGVMATLDGAVRRLLGRLNGKLFGRGQRLTPNIKAILARRAIGAALSPEAVERAEEWLSFASRGQTAGEALLARVGSDPRYGLELLKGLGGRKDREPFMAEVVAVIVFQPAD